jgi:hypothetical protein
MDWDFYQLYNNSMDVEKHHIIQYKFEIIHHTVLHNILDLRTLRLMYQVLCTNMLFVIRESNYC